MHDKIPAGSDEGLRRLYENATQPELRGWLTRNPESRQAARRGRDG